MAEIKRVTLHPLYDDGTINKNINIYPKTLIDGIVDREGNPIDIPALIDQEKERAESVEQELHNKINDEKTRAQTVEESLNTKIHQEVEERLLADIDLSNRIEYINTNYYNKLETDNLLLQKEDLQNKVNVISDQSTNTEYPSALAVKDYVALTKKYVDNFFVDKATEQIVTGVKHFKADNTALENLGVYGDETILEKATKIKVGGSDAFNIDAEADYTNFWKLTSFLGTTKIAVNDTQAVNFIAYEADSFLEKPTTFKINGDSVLKTSAEGGGKAIFDKPADFHSLVYVGGHEIRFPDYVDFTDNTAQHNKVATIANDYANFYKTSTFKSNVNVDGLMFAGGHEIRFPEYVEFKDNTAAHNTVLRVDQNFIDANKVITAKQGLNIDVTPTQAQHAVRKDYVDNKPNLIKITWSELKALRDNGQLIPGRFYRIKDYKCTTSQPGTQSAGRIFDIIVRADSENKLNEEASAIQRSGWNDFYYNNLKAWKLWYCLDNDGDRFSWATDAGKGVIYRMIDEFGNDCPYDFKNILFTRPNSYQNAYTFSYTENGVIKDASILGKDKKCYNNIIKKYVDAVEHNRQALNFNVFYSTSDMFVCYSNTFGADCHNNTFGNNCYNNAFGSGCNYIIFGTRSGLTNMQANYYQNNIIDSSCSYLCLNANGSASASNWVQNIHVHLGVKGTSSEYKTITVDRNLSYTTDVYPIGSTEMFI